MIPFVPCCRWGGAKVYRRFRLRLVPSLLEARVKGAGEALLLFDFSLTFLARKNFEEGKVVDLIYDLKLLLSSRLVLIGKRSLGIQCSEKVESNRHHRHLGSNECARSIPRTFSIKHCPLHIVQRTLTHS
jgi:hypothetical protein